MNKYVLDLNSVFRIYFKREGDMIVVFVDRVKWDEDERYGNVTIFKGWPVLDFIRIYGDKDQLVRLVVEFCKRLGDDFRREVVRRLLKDNNTEDEFKEFIKEFEDVIYPFVGHIPKYPDEWDEDESQ